MAELDRNGYAKSIMQTDMRKCFRCGRTTGKLDRHEVFPGPNRQKSKRLGLWVVLCHQDCHLNGAHAQQKIALALKQAGQVAAMKTYGWTKEDFIREIGRNYL